MVNVLVIGSGGREHALSWKLSQSSKVETVFTAPGNGGTENNVPLDVNDLDGLAEFAQRNNCFTVVGPEDPLAAGIVDKFNQLNLKVFGPSKEAAQLESSKIWAKNFMKRNNAFPAKKLFCLSKSSFSKQFFLPIVFFQNRAEQIKTFSYQQKFLFKYFNFPAAEQKTKTLFPYTL